MFHDRVVSGFDLEVLFGEPCVAAILRAGLGAALGPDGAVDLSEYATVAPDDRFLHVRLSDVDLHGGEAHGDVTIKLRLGLGPSALEAGLGRRVANVASPPAPGRPDTSAPVKQVQPRAPQPVTGRPLPTPQGPPPREVAPSSGGGGPLPETHLAFKLRVRGEGAKLIVEPGVNARELVALATWLTQQVSGPVGLAVTGFVESTLRSLSFEVAGLRGLPRLHWAWLVADAQTRPALALLANLDLDFRAKNTDPRPSAATRGNPAALRNHLPPGVAVRAAAPAATLGRLQRDMFWRLPNRIDRAYLQKFELLLRDTEPGYVDVRIEFEIELPGLNGSLAYQVPVVPKVVGGALQWQIGQVARATDLNVDAWSAILNGLIVLPNLFGAGITWAGEHVRTGSDELGRRLSQSLAPLAGALPTRIEVLRVGERAASVGLAAAAVEVDGKGLSFHLDVRP